MTAGIFATILIILATIGLGASLKWLGEVLIDRFYGDYEEEEAEVIQLSEYRNIEKKET